MESLFGLEQHIVIGAEELPPVYKRYGYVAKVTEKVQLYLIIVTVYITTRTEIGAFTFTKWQLTLVTLHVSNIYTQVDAHAITHECTHTHNRDMLLNAIIQSNCRDIILSTEYYII